MLGLIEADLPQALGGEPFVDLLEVLPHKPLLSVRDLALVRLSRMLQAGVVRAIANARTAPGAAPGRPGRDQELMHRLVRSELIEGSDVHGCPSRLVLAGKIQ